MRTRLARQKARDELLNRRIVLDFPDLPMIVILRNNHVAGIPNNVDNTRITRIEALVALNNAWARQAIEVSFGSASRIRNQSIDIRPRDVLIGKSQIREEKPRPGIAGFGKRNEKYIIRENEQTATWTM
jgi:hypothetical protein